MCVRVCVTHVCVSMCCVRVGTGHRGCGTVDPQLYGNENRNLRFHLVSPRKRDVCTDAKKHEYKQRR